MSSLYNRISEQTERLGITGKDLGNLLGLRKSPLTDWKNQKSSPTLAQLMKLCEIFAVSADYLLYGKTDALSEEQQELIDTYGNLDRRGQHKVHAVIYAEMDRIMANTIIKKAGHANHAFLTYQTSPSNSAYSQTTPHAKIHIAND